MYDKVEKSFLISSFVLEEFNGPNKLRMWDEGNFVDHRN